MPQRSAGSVGSLSFGSLAAVATPLLIRRGGGFGFGMKQSGCAGAFPGRLVWFAFTWFALACPASGAPEAYFARDGGLVGVRGGVVRRVVPPGQAATPGVVSPRVVSLGVAACSGAVPDGRLVATLQPATAATAIAGAAQDPDPHCSTVTAGTARCLRPDGAVDARTRRGCAAGISFAGGRAVALISPQRDLSLWRDGVTTAIAAPGRVSHAAWSPDGRLLALCVYPPDWSEGAASAARTAAEFLRMQNADIHLFDTARMQFASRLTSDPGTEYGPFFSPDGRALFFTWLHPTEDRGGLMRLDLDRDGGTSASAPARQLTTAGNDAGETPVGRVGTYVWQSGGARLAFEAGRPDGSGEIWAVGADGAGAARLAAGRKPQPAGDSAVVFLNDKGVPETISTEARP